MPDSPVKCPDVIKDKIDTRVALHAVRSEKVAIGNKLDKVWCKYGTESTYKNFYVIEWNLNNSKLKTSQTFRVFLENSNRTLLYEQNF